MIGIKDQCFGVEIELTGITRAEAAEALGAYFGTTPQRSYDNYDSWYIPDREGKQWRIMSDGSIRAEWNDDGHYRRTTDPEYRVEMVTPKLTYEEMEKFQECVRRIRQAGRRKSQRFLRDARPCGRLQAYPTEPEKRPLHHVFQRGHPVQSPQCQ